MRLVAFLLALAGGLLVFVSAAAVFMFVTGNRLMVQLSLAILLAAAIIALAWKGSYGSDPSHNAGIVLILLSLVALILGFVSPVFALRPLLVGYGLSLIGGIVMLLVTRHTALA